MNLMVALFVLTSQFREMASAVAYGQPSATLWKDQLFVAVGEDWRAFGWLWRGTFSQAKREVRFPSEYGNPATTIYGFQSKLEIRDNRILLFGDGVRSPRILALADLPLLEWNDFGDALVEARGYPNRGHVDNWLICGDSEPLLFPPHRKPDVPAPPFPIDPALRAFTLEEKEVCWRRRYAERGRFDVQLAGSKSVRLFHAYKDRLFVSIEPDYLRPWYLDQETGDPVKNLPPPPDRELRTGKLPADFTEKFAAYTAGKRDYLVTNNGKAYMAVPKGKDGVEVTSVWDDPKQRIVGVVQDPANDAVYGWGFAGADGSAERFYVKLDPKPVAVPYKLTVPLWNDRSDAYLESYECARAFRKAAEKK